MTGPIVPPRALTHIERALDAAKDLEAALARAAQICELAAKEGAPRDTCVYLDMLAASAKEQRGAIERLYSLTVNVTMDRRKDPRT